MPSGDVFRENLAALQETDPELAGRIRGIPLPEGGMLRTASGALTLKVRGEDGAELFLHSRNDPEAEALALLSKVPKEGVTIYLVYGLGVGYHVARLLREVPPASRFVVLEKSLEHLRLCLDIHSWAGPIRANRMMFLVDLPKPQMTSKLGKYALGFFARTELVVHPASMRAFPLYYQGSRAVLSEFFDFTKMNLHTLATLSRITTLNLCMNLPSYAFGAGVKDLQGAARGRPVVIVSAGPSLAKNLHLLNEAARGALLIAVPTVFKTLLDRGVVPDFVATLDYHKISGKYFEGLDDAPPVTLLADPKVSYAVVDAYRGPKRFSSHPFLQQVLGGVVEDRGSIRWGATVAHLALYIAEYLEADPIVFVGQDLCHPHGITHMPGTPIHDNWFPEMNRFTTFEMKEWETLMRIRPILRRTADVDGNPVFTDEQMFTYQVRFEEDFARIRSRIIDATEGGVSKRGTERMSLGEVIDRFCREPFGRERVSLAPASPPDPGFHKRVLERVQLRRQEMESARDFYQGMVDRLEKVRARIDRGESPSDAIRKAHEEARRIDGFMEIHQLVAGLAQSDEFNRVKADLEMATTPRPPAGRQKQELARDLAYMGGLRNAAETLAAFLKVSAERLEAVKPP